MGVGALAVGRGEERCRRAAAVEGVGTGAGELEQNDGKQEVERQHGEQTAAEELVRQELQWVQRVEWEVDEEEVRLAG